MLIGSRDPDFETERITLNGMEKPELWLMKRGEKYRLRIINMAPNLPANVRLGTKERPATWRAVAKDGADLPARLVKIGDAMLHIASGETYDFEFQPDAPGEFALEVVNSVNGAKLTSKVVVQ